MAFTSSVGTATASMAQPVYQPDVAKKTNPLADSIFPVKDIKKTSATTPDTSPIEAEIKRLETMKAMAKANYEKDLLSKKLIYVPATKNIFGKETPAHYIYNVDEKGETFGGIKSHYNLPDGFFKKHFGPSDGGNKDLYVTYGTLEIPADVLEQSVGYDQKK